MDSAAINYRDFSYLRRAGLDALKKELGSVGVVYFLRQFSTGYGDYTKERETLLANDSLEDVLKGVKEMDAAWRKSHNQYS